MKGFYKMSIGSINDYVIIRFDVGLLRLKITIYKPHGKLQIVD